MTQDVTNYLLKDRQWPRHLRIAHAKMQVARAQLCFSDEDVQKLNFWQQILDANGTMMQEPKSYLKDNQR